MVYRYAVGEPYNPRVTSWPEAAQLRLTVETGAELVMFFNSPTEAEREAAARGPARFAWIDSEHVGVLCYRFEPGIPWSDAPYTPHREEKYTAGVPGPAGRHLLVLVYLVDATTGLIQAMRQVTWPPRFADAVRESVARMAAAPFSAAAADDALDAIFARYPDTADLVRHRADVTCRGGTDEAAAGSGRDASP